MQTQSKVALGVGTIGLISLAYKYYKDCQGQEKEYQVQQHAEKLKINELMSVYSKEFNNSKTIQNIIPRVFEKNEQLSKIVSNLHYIQKNAHLSSLTSSLSQPIFDLLDRGGKRWRPIICMLIAQMYGRKKEQVYDIAALCEIIHNGTLIIDDIEDSSQVRRDKTCVHLIYGVDISVNAGNFMYFAPLNYILKNGKHSVNQLVKIGQIYAQQMTNLHIGQGWDILWHNIDKLNGKYPTQDDYLQMTAHKTGVLARLSSRLVCNYLNLSEKQTNALARFSQTMGVAFQIQDDLLNLQGKEQFIKTKGYLGEDIHEGKLTLMVLHFLQSVDSLKQNKLLQILKKKTKDPVEIECAIEMMRDSGSLCYAKNKMHELVKNSLSQIQQNLPENQFRQYLCDLAYFGIKRNK